MEQNFFMVDAGLDVYEEWIDLSRVEFLKIIKSDDDVHPWYCVKFYMEAGVIFETRLCDKGYQELRKRLSRCAKSILPRE